MWPVKCESQWLSSVCCVQEMVGVAIMLDREKLNMRVSG